MKLLRRAVKDRLVDKFVKDAILHAAVDQAAYDLLHTNLLPVFVECFWRQMPVATDNEQIIGYTKDGASVDRSEPGHHAILDPVIVRFHQYLSTPEPRSGVQYVDAESSDPISLIQHYAGAISDAARCLPWPPFRGSRAPPFQESFADPFISSLLRSPVLVQLEDLAAISDELLVQDFDAQGVLDAKAHRNDALRNLSHAFKDVTQKAAFSCNGTLPLTTVKDRLSLRFDTVDAALGKVTFDGDILSTNPMATRKNEPAAKPGFSVTSALDMLITACQKATFGYDGKDILDIGYRNALGLDPSKFSINFHPADFGIIDTITEVMLPSLPERARLRAELYKLNIYEECGRFRPHFDTPRSETLIGSLVVCLPIAHTGGDLIIRHVGKEVVYRWGECTDELSWAAFYSDCEHEVKEVTGGNRVTLTYNLHVVPVAAATVSSGLQFRSTPIYEALQHYAQQPHVLPPNGLIGIYCQHVYPRHRRTPVAELSAYLKGADRLLWLSLKSLGFHVGIAIVLDRSEINERELDRREYSTLRSRESADDSDEDADDLFMTGSGTKKDGMWDQEFDDLIEAIEHTTSAFEIPYKAGATSRPTDLSTFEERLTDLLATRRIVGLPDPELFSDDLVPDRLGLNFTDTECRNFPFEEGDDDELFKRWPEVHDIHWLNEQHEMKNERALTYIKYGNEAELDHYYASISIIARVPITGLPVGQRSSVE